MFRSAFYIICALLVSSCQHFESAKEKKDKPIARVYDKYLYETDIAGVGKGAARTDDSIQAVRNYIDSWVRHNLMVRYAEDNLPDEEQKLTDRLRDYKESLLIYQYENKLVSQKLDTTVKGDEIERYYAAHKDIFSLRDDIVKLQYIVVKANITYPMDSVRSWLKHFNSYTEPKLLGFCRQFAIRYSIADSIWYNKADAGSFLPVNLFNPENAIYKRSYVEVSDSAYQYLIKFNDYRIKGSDAPVDFARSEIASMIVNQRKMAFVGSIHKSVYEDALKNGDFEVYEENKNR